VLARWGFNAPFQQNWLYQRRKARGGKLSSVKEGQPYIIFIMKIVHEVHTKKKFKKINWIKESTSQSKSQSLLSLNFKKPQRDPEALLNYYASAYNRETTMTPQEKTKSNDKNKHASLTKIYITQNQHRQKLYSQA